MRATASVVVMTVVLFAAAAGADTTETHFYSGAMSPANEVPAITGVTASAQATITAVVRRDSGGNIVSGTVYFDVDYSFGAPATVTGLHIHEGGAGINGPIRINTGISATNTVAVQGTGNIFRAVEVTDGAPLAALIGLVANPSGFYVNLHTSVNTGGLMRDQLQAATQPPPNVFDGGVVNNASYALAPNPLAPGSLAAVFGKYLNNGPAALSSSFGSDGKLITSLGGTEATVNGIAAPIFYSTFTQVGIQIPAELAGQTSATILVTVGGKTSVSRTITLDAAAPGLFTVNQAGTGPAAMLHQDGITPVTASNPAQPNEVVVLFGTGLGATEPALATGVPSAGNRVAATPTVTIDGVQVAMDFAGRAPGYVGLDQLNVHVPANARTANDLAIVVSAGSRQSNPATVAVGSGTGSTSNPAPAISSLAPNFAYVGDPAFVMTISGSGFVPGSTVFVDDAARAATYISDTQMTVGMTATDCSLQQTIAVRVENPAPGGGSSNVSNFSVMPAPPGYNYGDY